MYKNKLSLVDRMMSNILYKYLKCDSGYIQMRK